MSHGFLEHIKSVPDHRISGMVTYPLDEILLACLVSVVCGAEDWDEVEEISELCLDWLRKFLPFSSGIPSAQTFRKVFRLLDARSVEKAFAGWARGLVGGDTAKLIALDGKCLRGTGDGDDARALNVVSAYACEAGLVLASRAVDRKSNEITAIPELLALLHLEGAIVTLDAMGTQKKIAEQIIEAKGDYVLALKGNQTTLHQDVVDFFNDPVLTATAARYNCTDAGHGRIEERQCLAIDAAWLAKRHPEWPNLKTVAAITNRRIDKQTGAESCETRYFIASLPPDPKPLLEAVRAHWGIEIFHWVLDVTFDEDACLTRKDNAPLNLAVIRRAAFNLLKAEKTKLSMKRKRLRAALDPAYRNAVFNR